MAKRKIDSCTLDEFVFKYLKKSKYEKTAKLLGEINIGNSKIMKNFIKFVKINEKLKNEAIKKENLDDDDLGFEINFGAYQSSEPRLKISETKRPKNGTDGKREKIEVPKKFMKKIRKLGLREEDADILYKSKIDWTSVYLGRVSICAFRGCVFPMVICSEFRMGQHRVNDHPYHAPQFRWLSRPV